MAAPRRRRAIWFFKKNFTDICCGMLCKVGIGRRLLGAVDDHLIPKVRNLTQRTPWALATLEDATRPDPRTAAVVKRSASLD